VGGRDKPGHDKKSILQFAADKTSSFCIADFANTSWSRPSSFAA
jgi:hypothetical protein